MKKTLLTTATLALVCGVSSSVMAAALLPHATVIHVPVVAMTADNSPVIKGKLINQGSGKPLYLTDYMQVPHSFPAVIASASAGNYSVSPELQSGGYELWTNPVKYVTKDNNGCFIQFAWHTVDQTIDIGITNIGGYNMSCQWSEDGSNISINTVNPGH